MADISYFRSAGTINPLWYSSPCTSFNIGNCPGLQNGYMLTPVVFTKPSLILNLGITITSPDPVGLYNLALYTDSGNMMPLNLISGSDIGNQSGAVSGFFSFPVNLQIRAETVIWMGLTTNSTILNFQQGDSLGGFLGFEPVAGEPCLGVASVPSSYSDFPSSFIPGQLTFNLSTIPMPIIYFQLG